MNPKNLLHAALGLLAMATLTGAQPFTKADSGWVPLFNGTNFDGLYSRMYNHEVTDIPNKTFSVVDGTIKVTQGSGWEEGPIGTDKQYTHYRARVEYKFDGTNGNAGFTYHTDETVPRMDNNWPRSIECQMMQGNAGRAYSIAMATFNTKQSNGNYNPNGTEVLVCERSPCNARDYGASVILDKRGEWNKMEIVVRGSDSALHRVNDSTVMRVRNIKIPDPADATKWIPYGKGSIAVQAEGTGITYRNWEVMELHPDGPSRLDRILLSNTNGGAKLTAGTTHNITWRSIGDVKRVSVFFNTGTGGWEMAADNVNNTGTFAWTVPSAATTRLRVLVSAAPWVLADTSDADNQISGISGIARPLIGSFDPAVSMEGFNPAGIRDISARVQGSRSGKAFRVLFHRP